MEPLVPANDIAVIEEQHPCLEEYDVLSRGDEWVALSSHEAALIRLLLGRFGRVVARNHLNTALWPGGSCSSAPLNQLIARARRRIEPLGLEICTVRRRGYALRFIRRT